MASRRTRVDVVAHRARGVGALAHGAEHQAPARPPQHEAHRGGRDEADHEQRVDLQRRAHLGRVLLQSASDTDGRCGAVGPISGLPRKNARPDAEQHQRDADRDVVDARAGAQPGVQRARAATPPRPRASTPSHGEPVRYGDAVGGHRAHHQRALETQVHAPALLGQALAQADEQERRADADGAAHDRQGDARAARCAAPPRPAAFGAAQRNHARARTKRLRQQDADEQHPLQHVHGRVGQIERALQEPPAGADAAEQDRHRDDGRAGLARDERDQHAGVAVARHQRRVGRAVDGRHLDRTRQAGRHARRGTSRRRSAAARAGRSASRPGRCRRPCAPKSRTVVRCIEHPAHQARHQTAHASPSARRGPGSVPSMLSSPIGSVDGLFRLAGSRSGPSTRWLSSAMAM